MTNLERLEKDIREKLPRLMELTEGCVINYKHSDANVINKRGSEYCLVKASGIVEWVKDYVIINYRIIGHDPMLSDVLEWYSFTNGLCFDPPRQSIYGFYFKTFAWDLSKPHLKDQSQELIDYLASLI